MDEFRKVQHSCCGVGGINCECCNPFGGDKKDKRVLNKMSRSILKRELKKDLNETTLEIEK